MTFIKLRIFYLRSCYRRFLVILVSPVVPISLKVMAHTTSQFMSFLFLKNVNKSKSQRIVFTDIECMSSQGLIFYYEVPSSLSRDIFFFDQNLFESNGELPTPCMIEWKASGIYLRDRTLYIALFVLTDLFFLV